MRQRRASKHRQRHQRAAEQRAQHVLQSLVRPAARSSGRRGVRQGPRCLHGGHLPGLCVADLADPRACAWDEVQLGRAELSARWLRRRTARCEPRGGALRMHGTQVAPAGAGQLSQRQARAHCIFSSAARAARVVLSPRDEAMRSALARRTRGRCDIQAPPARAQLAARPEVAQRKQAQHLLCCHSPLRQPLPSSHSPPPAQDLPPRRLRLVPWPPERAGLVPSFPPCLL